MIKMLKNLFGGFSNQGTQSVKMLDEYKSSISDLLNNSHISDLFNNRSSKLTSIDDFLDPAKKTEDLTGLTDDGLKALRPEVLDSIKHDNFLTPAGMNTMLENFDATGNLYGSAASIAGETAGSPLVNLLAGAGSPGALGLLGTAALAGGANVAMGGDFSSGAMVGLGVAGLTRGLTKGYLDNMADIEKAGITDILGKANKQIASSGAYKTNLKVTAKRSQNLESVKYIADNNAGVFDKELVDEAKKFIGNKGPNRVVAHNRAMTVGGGMLAGVAFTGRSDKRDYRRGFNSHRGNRI